MKTHLPSKITSASEAKKFLTELFKNNEHYHPENSAHEIIWDMSIKDVPTKSQRNHLDNLMAACFQYTDPCGILLNLQTK